jgi:hypothetical protein
MFDYLFAIINYLIVISILILSNNKQIFHEKLPEALVL